MRYESVVPARFLDRPNRFLAHVELCGGIETVHVKNTGRCRELLLPGAQVILTPADRPGRKTAWDLIAVRKEGLGWVNIDSQILNPVVREWLEEQGFDCIRPEYTFGSSRFDFYMEKDGRKHLLEVKGCTLERDGLGWFPDAPSLRAARHCRELALAQAGGYECTVAFVIAMEGVDRVCPNEAQDPAFARALREAKDAGVRVVHLGCSVEPDRIRISRVNVE